MSDHILIIDRDSEISSMLYKVFHSHGFVSDIVTTEEAALLSLNTHLYDLILFDIDAHELHGFELIQKIRQKGLKIPVILLSSPTADFDIIYGLNIGADDYLVKPINPLILTAKVKALLRRSKHQLLNANQILTAGPFTYDLNTLRFYKNNEEIFLSSKENAMMKLFMDNVNRIFSKDMIYNLVWGEAIIDENTIMVYINRLRQKIEDNPSKPQYIKTIRGLGYRFMV